MFRVFRVEGFGLGELEGAGIRGFAIWGLGFRA